MKRTQITGLALLAACAASPQAQPEQRLGVPLGATVPDWAKALAGPLPATARAMLDLDHLQRANNPLGPTLTARLHLAAAEELRCAPLATAAMTGLAAGDATAHERLAVDFARQATRAAHQIDDTAFADLLAAFGVERTVAIVHTVAYANFLCRVVHGLGVTGPLAIGARPDAAAPTPAAPVRTGPPAIASAVTFDRLQWTAGDWTQLQAAQRHQQERTPRVPRPEAHRLTGLSDRERDSTRRVVWSDIAYGYQPELTRAWFRCLYAFHGEAKLDDVFTNSLFWVVTRTKDCFY